MRSLSVSQSPADCRAPALGTRTRPQRALSAGAGGGHSAQQCHRARNRIAATTAFTIPSDLLPLLPLPQPLHHPGCGHQHCPQAAPGGMGRQQRELHACARGLGPHCPFPPALSGTVGDVMSASALPLTPPANRTRAGTYAASSQTRGLNREGQQVLSTLGLTEFAEQMTSHLEHWSCESFSIQPAAWGWRGRWATGAARGQGAPWRASTGRPQPR